MCHEISFNLYDNFRHSRVFTPSFVDASGNLLTMYKAVFLFRETLY
jgi:hypothetical protein